MRNFLDRSGRFLTGGVSVVAVMAAIGLGSTVANASGVADVEAGLEGSSEIYSGDAILVTARRKIENVQDVPISISVIGGGRLEETNAVTLDQIKQLAPSLQIFAVNPRNTNINIRNLGSNATSTGDGLDPGVGVYIDDVYYARPGQAVFDLVDVDRIEILKGPQGTLFGRNTTAGAISISTRAPSFTPEASVELSVGNYDYVQARAAVSVPLIADALAIRLTGTTSIRDGFIRNVATGGRIHNLNSQALRGQILAKFSDSFSLRVIGDYSVRSEDCCASSVAGAATALPDGTPINGNVVERFERIGYLPPSLNAFDRVTDVDAPLHYEVKQWGVSGNAEWVSDSFSLKSISSYRTWSWQPSNDFDSLGLSVLKRLQSDQTQKQFTQELRIASEGQRTIDYVAGLYYFYQSLPQLQTTEYGADAPAYQLPYTVPAAIGNPALIGFTTQSVSSVKTWSYAAFGQVNWNIDPRLTLTVGARYTYEKKDGFFNQRQVGGVDLSTLPAAVAAAAQALRNNFGRENFYEATVKKGSFSGQASLAYKAGNNLLAYATYARGAKSGGLNIGNIPVGVNPVVKPEAVDHFEGGVKSSPLPGVTLNGALFWTEIKGFQSTFSETEPPRSYLTNAARVRSRGAEVDLNVAPVSWAKFYASATYADAIYVSYPKAPCPPGTTGVAGVCDLSGVDLPNTPKWTLSAGGDISRPVGTSDAYIGVDWSYRSSFNSATNSSPFGEVPSHSLVNARVGVRAGDKSWDIYVWARNLFNANYYLNYGYANNGLITARIGDPRTAGLTGRFNF